MNAFICLTILFAMAVVHQIRWWRLYSTTHLWTRRWLRSPSPEAQHLEQWGHWKSVVVITAEAVLIDNRWFIVRRPVHRGNPTLSAREVLIQWHGEPLRQETARLQWMTRTSLGVMSCSRHSNNAYCHCLHIRWFFRWTLPPGVRFLIQ